jgi:hypothetical protein
LSRLTHDFEEWKQNDPGTSSRRIPLRDMLAALGLADCAGEIAEDALHLARTERELGQDDPRWAMALSARK